MSIFFERFEGRHTIQADLELRTGLRIGAGRETGAADTDLPILRTGRDKAPFIPGSTWKGVVRSHAERLLRGIGGERWQPWACDPFAGASCVPTEKDKDKDNASARERQEKQRRLVQDHACLACRTFGGHSLASHVRFYDSILTNAQTMARDGVAIDRDLGRARDGLKYEYEVIEAGVHVPLRIDLDNAEDWQVGLLLLVVEELAQGALRVGGAGSRGLGWLALAPGSQVEVRRHDLAQVLARQREGTPITDFAPLFQALSRITPSPKA